MRPLVEFFNRTTAFIYKEIAEILRRPMLIITLVLGPFLILLLFGIGFRNEPRSLRTLFVVSSSDQAFVERVEEYGQSLGPQLIFSGISHDRAEATERLLRGEIDLIVNIPSQPAESIRKNEPVVLELDHYEIDPLQVEYVNVFGQVYIDEINRRVLQAIAEQGQENTGDIRSSLAATRHSLTALQQAIQANDETAIRREERHLKQEANVLAQLVGGSLSLAQGVEEAMGQEQQPGEAANLEGSLAELILEVDALEGSELNQPTAAEQQLEKIETDLSMLEAALGEFNQINPDVLVRPFRSEIRSIGTMSLTSADFFAPAVIALLLQHLAITLAALSVVGERQIGTIELFRVSPVTAFETILGKYLSYLLFSGVLAAVLTGLVILLLRVPMLGSWELYSTTIAALLFTSLGLGFIISLLAKNTSEAVQYSMITLLTSVFFSGALLSLEALWEPVRLVSWTMPATYGVWLLRKLMLRGYVGDFIPLIGLIVIGIVLFFIAWHLMRRLMAHD